MTRIDWPVALAWLAIAVAALLLLFAASMGLLWLVQHAVVAVWPWAQANSDRLANALLLGLLVALMALVLGRRR